MRHRAALPVVAAAAALSFAGQAVAWPLDDLTRRDSSDYLMTFLELGRAHPLFESQMVGRPPVAPLVLGGSLELSGPMLLEIVMGVAFVSTVIAYFTAVRRFGSLLGVVVASLLIVSFDVGALYHQVSSDALFATGLGFLALALAHAWTSPTPRAFGLVGLVAALCVLTRPSGLVVLPVLAACIIVVPGSWRAKTSRLAAYIAVGGLSVGLFATVNGVRYGQFAIASTGLPAPLYRLFAEEHLVSPDNGPASAELGRGVDDLVATQPYRAYGITADNVFRDGRNLMSWDIAWVARREWGNEAGSRLRDVVRETIRSHPGASARGALGTLLFYLRSRYFYPAPRLEQLEFDEPTQTFVTIGDQVLPKAPGSELIPAPHILNGWAFDPGGGYIFDWGDINDPHLSFTDTTKQARYSEILRKLATWDDALPARNGSPWLAARLNRFAENYVPSTLFWLVFGFAALAVRRPAYSLYFVTLAGVGLSIDALHAISMPRYHEYALPSAPLLIAFGAGALLAHKRSGENGHGGAAGNSRGVHV